MSHNINEKTRVSLGLPSLLTIVGSTVALVISIIIATWSIHSILSQDKLEQQKIDSDQYKKIERVDNKVDILQVDSQKSNMEIKAKLEQIILNQGEDHDKIQTVKIIQEYTNKTQNNK